MTTIRPIHVIVLAPLPVEKLDAAAEKAHRAERPFGDLRHPWELRAGAGAYSALITREPGTEASEWDLAEALSRASSEPVYSMWLAPDHPQMIYEWRRGKQVGERQGNPVEHARSVGIDLAPPDVPAPRHDAVITVAVIEGLAAAEVRQLLGDTADAGWLQISEARGSTILSAPDGDLRSAPWDLTDALPERDVYFISGDRARRELNIQVLRDGETIGTFDVPPVRSDVTLSAIRGATTVSGILDALGVGPELFPRDGWRE